ncbi:MAG TPA: NDP-sugar synthase [Candidatus Binatia bacterium]|nr:NDP-sugar synthase [Candidatus Binatia bacterium]
MILAAGQGTRLRPTTDTVPKALVPVAGRAMIEYVLLLLRHYGIKDIIINLHHFGAQIESRLGDGKMLGLRITYSREPELLDTGGGLLKAKSFLQDGAFIVINTDALIDVDLAALIDFHAKNAAAATLVLRPDPRADEYGSMDIDAQGRICRFLHSTAPITPSGQVVKLMFTGVQILDPSVFAHMENYAASPKFSTTKDVYPRMLTDGARLFGFRFDGFWQDVGTPERIREAELKLQNAQARLHYL